MSNYRRLLWATCASLALCVVLPTGARAASEPTLTLRTFCQADASSGNYGVYVPIAAEGFPANGTGTFTIDFPQLVGYGSSFPFETNRFGASETSIGFGLSGLEDPLLGNDLVITITVGETSVTETVTLICDPNANGPTDRAECEHAVFRFFFGFLGYSFINRGDCVAFVSTSGRNPPSGPNAVSA